MNLCLVVTAVLYSHTKEEEQSSGNSSYLVVDLLCVLTIKDQFFDFAKPEANRNWTVHSPKKASENTVFVPSVSRIAFSSW